MLGPIGSNLMSFLRLLTPYEVERLTKKAAEKSEVHSKTDAGVDLSTSLDNSQIPYDGQSSAHKDQQETGAKIIPFGQEQIQKSAEVQSSSGTDEVSDQQSLKILLKKKNNKKAKLKKKVVGLELFEEEDEEDVVKEPEITETEFIFSQKEKLKQSNLKMIGKEAINSYHKQASIDTGYEDTTDLSQSSSTGILVNKRQF